MECLRRVHGVTLRDKEHSSETVKPAMSSHFSESRDPSYVSSAMYIQNVLGKNVELGP